MTKEQNALTGDPRFFDRAGPYPLSLVAKTAGGEIAAGVDDAMLISGVAPLQSASPDRVSFLDNRRYLNALTATQAGAVIVHPDVADRVPQGTIPIVTPKPYRGWALVAALFHPEPANRPGIHPSAVIADGVVCDGSVEIGPGAVIENGVVIGKGCRIGPYVVIGAGVVLGENCRIGAHVTLSHALVGDRVTIYPGARIGQPGFGFDITPGENGFLTVPQLGRVVIGNDVEIGANTTIDRGSAQDTVIGPGSRLDNLVQIGHNVHLGRCCVIVAQAGVAGSAVLEDFAMVAAQGGVSGHVRIGRQARIGAQAGVMADVDAEADVVGSPAQPARQFFREVATLRKLVRDRQRPQTNGEKD